jgi:hypothetical protein
MKTRTVQTLEQSKAMEGKSYICLNSALDVPAAGKINVALKPTLDLKPCIIKRVTFLSTQEQVKFHFYEAATYTGGTTGACINFNRSYNVVNGEKYKNTDVATNVTVTGGVDLTGSGWLFIGKESNPAFGEFTNDEVEDEIVLTPGVTYVVEIENSSVSPANLQMTVRYTDRP